MSVKKNNKTIYYISEISLPNTSAQTVNVLKMCNEFQKHGKCVLIIPFLNNNFRKNIFKDYNIKKINFLSIFKKKIKITFIYRIIFAFKVFKYLKKKENKFIYTRSIITSFVLSFFKIKNILEVHHDFKGLTYIIYKLFSFKINKNTFYIFIHSYLLNFFKKNKIKYKILNDAVDFEKFKRQNIKIIKKKSCAYLGSFSKGKGVEIILKIAKKLTNINFDLYGDINFLDKKFLNLKLKNLKFYGYVTNSDVPKILKTYPVLLMPYDKKISVRSSNLSTERYMSPLKLYEYMACGRVVIASKLKVYSNILKNNQNCFLIPPKDIKKWCRTISNVLSNYNSYKYIQKNSIEIAKNNTWVKRVTEIYKIYAEKIK